MGNDTPTERAKCLEKEKCGDRASNGAATSTRYLRVTMPETAPLLVPRTAIAKARAAMTPLAAIIQHQPIARPDAGPPRGLDPVRFVLEQTFRADGNSARLSECIGSRVWTVSAAFYPSLIRAPNSFAFPVQVRGRSRMPAPANE